MWYLPKSGIEPMCPALAGGFLTSELPEKPVLFCLFVLITDINKLAQTEYHVSLRPWHRYIYH